VCACVCVHVFGDSHLAEKAQSVQQASDAKNIMCAAKPRHGRHFTAAAKEVQEQLSIAQNTKKEALAAMMVLAMVTQMPSDQALC